MSRLPKTLFATAALLGVLASAGCQPSITSQLEAGLPEAAHRPTTMPNEVGKDADKVATELMDAKVKVRVAVPERTVPASATASGGQVIGVFVKPVSVDMVQSDRRFVGFKVISQTPSAGAALGAAEGVVLAVGAHPNAPAGATWYSSHVADAKRQGDASCLNTGGAGQTGCHTQSYCVSCHAKAIKQPKLKKP